MDKQKKKGKIFTIVLAATSVLVMCIFFGNTVLFSKALDRIAQQYVSDSNGKLAANISYRLKSGKEFVTDFADTLGRMPEFLLTEELLKRKCDDMELENLAVVSVEYEIFPQVEDDCIREWLEENPQVWKKPMVSYIKDKSIIFSAPVKRENKLTGLVVGMQCYKDIQSLISMSDYFGHGISILLDMDNSRRIIMEGKTDNPISDKDMKELLQKAKSNSNCVYRKKLSYSKEVFVDVAAVQGTEWMQIAIMPSDILIQNIAIFMNIYIVLVGVVILLFVLLIRKLLREHRKKEKMFYTDPLTGCYNREGFIRECCKITDCRDFDSYVIVYLNVVGFRHINESWGEEDGNRTLKFIYRKFTENLKEHEMIGRSGMDHFFMLLKESANTAVAERIIKTMQDINEIINRKFSGYMVEFTSGACRLNEKSGRVSSIMNKAVYASKLESEKNQCVFFDKKISDRFDREKWLNDMFEESIKNHYFKVYLQPKVSPLHNQPCQAEALVRWIHPEVGMISPGDFIPLFEKNGKISQLDLYMFEEICRLVDKWIREGKTVTRVSVNLSRYHLRGTGSDVWKEYRSIKEKYHIPDGILELELTETVFLEDSQLYFVKTILDNLCSCGFGVSLDDFGFAYSSLSLLKDFQVDVLKLDRDFFVNENEKSRKIVENIIRMAHSLGMKVTAEGIELPNQVEVLKEMDCDLIQGYVYSRPLPVEEFEKWRDQYNRDNQISV